jgi:hypothetical protein
MTLSGSKDCYRIKEEKLISRRKPRICMPTARHFARNAFRCGNCEAEDVLVSVDDVDLIYLKPGKAFELRQSIHKRMVWHDFSRKLVSTNLAFQPIRLAREYELFLVYMPLSQDLISIPSVLGWKDYCKTSVCWIDEIWTVEVPKLKSWLSALTEFDHIVISLKGTAKAINAAIGRECHFVPVAVDAIRFSPHPQNPDRVIDIYNMGRKWEGLHQALINFSARKNLFYVYDTFNASHAEVGDYRQHRDMLSNFAKRSRYFVVAPAKMDMAEETNGQIEVGLRYYEASAAGAVMLGQVPDCEVFKTMFDWPDAVIEVNPDGSDLADILSSAASEAKWMAEISRRNATEALLRHDWVYRWKKILDIAGLTPGPEMEIREKKLKQMAEQVGNGL